MAGIPDDAQYGNFSGIPSDLTRKVAPTPPTAQNQPTVQQSAVNKNVLNQLLAKASAPAATPAPAVASPSITNSAQMSPELMALLGRSNKYLDTLQSGTGGAMDDAMQKVRDAREGGLKAIGQGSSLSGMASTPGIQRYSDETTRQQEQAAVQTKLGREAMTGSALQGATTIARAPLDVALAEKGLGLQSANLNLAAQQQAQQAQGSEYDRLLALLNATRTSPVYVGPNTGLTQIG